MKRLKKIGLVIAMVALIATLGFAATWIDSDQTINLQGIITSEDVTGMNLIATYNTATYVNGNTILDLDLVNGSSVAFELQNNTLANMAEDKTYQVDFDITPFSTNPGTNTEDFDQETVTLTAFTPSNNDYTVVGNKKYTVSTETTTTGKDATINVIYRVGQTAAEEVFATFTAVWAGSTTLKPGTYVSTVTAAFTAL